MRVGETVHYGVASITKVAAAQPCGEYVPTLLDEAKRHAEILITGCGGGYTIQCKPGVIVQGRGVRSDYGNGCYMVTEKKLESLQRSYSSATDF